MASPALLHQELRALEGRPLYFEALQMLITHGLVRPLLALEPTRCAASILLAAMRSARPHLELRFFPTPAESAMEALLKEWSAVTSHPGRSSRMVEMWEITTHHVAAYHPDLPATIERLIRQEAGLAALDQEFALFLVGLVFGMANRTRFQVEQVVNTIMMRSHREAPPTS